MRRPLQELPLELFLPASSKSGGLRPNKRPLSPGAPNLFSPTKRRILEEEGIFSPEKTTKSPFPPSRGKGSAHFSAVLCGTESPACKLDFSPSKPATTEEWRSSNGTDRATSCPSAQHASSSNTSSSSSSAQFKEFDIEFDDNFDELPSTLSHSRVPRLIPREMLPPQDPQSLHYPGFVIYQDTHILLPHASDSKPVLSFDRLADEEPENVPPRRKLKKAMTVPLSPGAAGIKKLDLGGSAKARCVPITPRAAFVSKAGSPSPTPRKPVVGLSPISTVTPRVDVATRRELRRMLEEEVDVTDCQDEEVYL